MSLLGLPLRPEALLLECYWVRLRGRLGPSRCFQDPLPEHGPLTRYRGFFASGFQIRRQYQAGSRLSDLP